MTSTRDENPDPRDPKDRRRKLKKDYWSATVTSGEVSVYAWERLERNGLVHIQFVDKARGPSGKRRKRALPGKLTVRDTDDRLDKAKIAVVERALQQAVAKLVLGIDPFEAAEQPDAADALTLRRAFRIALDPVNGKYAAQTRRVDEVKRARDKLERILKPDILLVKALAPSSVRDVWRTLAREYVSQSGLGVKRCGVRQTEVTVDALYCVGKWLETEQRLPAKSFARIDEWRTKLKEEWAGITKERLDQDHDGPRHTIEEMRSLYTALEDARRQLYRTLRRDIPDGALVHARWSDLTFDETATPVSLTVHWMRRERMRGVARVKWQSRPASQTHILDSSQRLALYGALHGYLQDLEAARVTGCFVDYPLFPSGTLVEGVIPASADAPLPLEPGGVLDLDERFEVAFTIGGEQRIGQVIRSMRSDLTIPEIDHRRVTLRTPEWGVLHPPSAGKKLSSPIALSAQEHDRLIDVLSTGYLREYEVSYGAGRIADYPLFPAGRMIRGVARHVATPQSLGRTGALKMFAQLESVAGVEHVPGRGWNGVRRIASDLVADVSPDERVQDAVTANTRDVRREHYQEHHRLVILQQAMDTRMAIRHGAPASPADTAPRMAALLAAVREANIDVTDEQAAALAAVLARPRNEPTDGAAD